MATLKSREQFCPGGFRFLQPETGWDSEAHVRGRSFSTIVRALIEHRLANPWLVTKHNWNTDYESVSNEVDAYTAALLQASGYTDFIQDGGGYSEPPKIHPLSHLSSRLGNAAGKSNIVAGVKTLTDWLGDGAAPVIPTLAKQRAETCVKCPMNGPGDWKKYFTGPVAALIKLQVGMKHDMKLETPVDSKLGVCTACDCPLQLKVWVDIEHILKSSTEEALRKMAVDGKACWVTKESLA